jgi:hypothetical protein
VRRSSERGFALVLALVLAVLYFGLIELMLIDSSRELAEARRFRARIVAETLAENGVELAAWDVVTRTNTNAKAQDWQGSMEGSMTRNPSSGKYTIVAAGRTSGLDESSARVTVTGQTTGNAVYIQYTTHTY